MSVPTVVIVGAGPRGISVLERLSANWRRNSEGPAAGLSVRLVDPAPAGGGRVWRHDQPAHLLMNTLCADATHYTDDTVQCTGPIVPGPTLYEWACAITAGDLGWGDPAVVAECAGIEPHSHPSRRLLGSYLRWCHQQDLAAMPPALSVVQHQATVVSARRDQDRWQVGLSDGQVLPADAIVLCNGHVDLQPIGEQAERVEHARRVNAWYGPPANPLDSAVESIPAGEPIVVRGLGMNFFDYLSLLSVGRGGEFSDGGRGRLRYRPSGNEPIMYVGSRRGVPYRAKGVFGQMTPRFPSRFLTKSVIDRLCRTPGVDFVEQMWPLIAKDGAWVYYEVLQRVEPERFQRGPAAVFAALDRHPWGSPELDEMIATATDVPLAFDDWDRPLRDRTFASVEEFTDWWLADLDHDLSEALGGLDSAEKCASIAIGQGRAPLRRMVGQCGIRGHSYDRDVDRWFRGFAGSLASGPPATRIAELLALTEAGVVRPIGPGLAVTDVPDGFTAESAAVGGSQVTARALLEAHLPPNRLQTTADPLLADLNRSGAVRPYRMPDPRTADDFVTGAVEVGPAPYRVVRSDGTETDDMYAFGVPVEHQHYGTQLGPLAGTNSQFLRDADAIARAVLTQVCGADSVVIGAVAEANSDELVKEGAP